MKCVLRPPVWLVASLALLATACDRDSPPKDDNPGAGTPVVLRGDERIGWDQRAVSGTNPSSYTYIMYVDGSPNTLNSVSCTGSSSAGYVCSSRLPSMSNGRHSLTLVASVGGVMSSPSTSLEVMMSLASYVPQEPNHEEAPVSQLQCEGGGACYRSTEILRSPGLISSPVSALNGRLLFVVDGRQVQVVSAASTVPTVLLSAEPSTKILSVAVPRNGPDAGSIVWVASTDAIADDARTLTVARYRLVEDTLGEAAVIVSMRTTAVDPRVVVDADSHIYIAMPATGNEPGSLLRLMPDGTTPRTQARPEFSAAPSVLSAMALTPAGQLWLSGVDDSGQWQLGQVESTATAAQFQTADSQITSLAFVRGTGAETGVSALAIANAMLYRTSVTGSELGSMQLVQSPQGIPIEVAADEGGVYLVTGTLVDRSVVYSLFRLSQ